ncbi:50S ribosomal protein L7 serine acetyltransferase [Dictyobacter alpinus]|uniref:50S ribosomal protein L7 serine acetyltransferase n=1 Tax=Dictyobacter alpinus TaxID=2014873 RepID=A0A402BJV8_9CHLR|nr:GNAT family protein [Dictyobacter alpinus]GCE31624.1 50S ribosomal protein L7 serine acetyltransferase [Dictyobacter alpinus]
MSGLALKIQVDDEIELRLNEVRYADEYLALILRNLEYLQEWMPWAAFEQTPTSLRAYMQNTMLQFVEGKGLPTNLWYRGQFAGTIGFSRMSHEQRMAEIGYWLDKDLQGRGIITKACRTLVDYAFQEYGFNKVEIHAAAGNKPSRSVAERLGFTQEGILRQVEWLKGKPHDMVVYGMLASEWTHK